MARQQVLKIRSGTDIDAKSHHSIFHTLLDSDLSATDKETDRLSKEGFVTVAAGGDTTGATISLILFHLIANPAKLTDYALSSHPSSVKLRLLLLGFSLNGYLT
jgi:cytochrome P450